MDQISPQRSGRNPLSLLHGEPDASALLFPLNGEQPLSPSKLIRCAAVLLSPTAEKVRLINNGKVKKKKPKVSGRCITASVKNRELGNARFSASQHNQEQLRERPA